MRGDLKLKTSTTAVKPLRSSSPTHRDLFYLRHSQQPSSAEVKTQTISQTACIVSLLEMLPPQVWVLLMVLCLSGLLVPGGGEQTTEILREDFIKDQALNRLLFLRFVSELMASREEMHRELEEEEAGGGRERLRRRHLRFRQRKAGCRNFFWKSFTAC